MDGMERALTPGEISDSDNFLLHAGVHSRVPKVFAPPQHVGERAHAVRMRVKTSRSQETLALWKACSASQVRGLTLRRPSLTAVSAHQHLMILGEARAEGIGRPTPANMAGLVLP